MGKDMEFLGKFGEVEWTVTEKSHSWANFCKRCEVYLAMDGADFEDTLGQLWGNLNTRQKVNQFLV